MPANAPNSVSLRLVTYNVKQIPGDDGLGSVFTSGDKDRQAGLLEYIKSHADIDVWVLQECFRPNVIRELEACFGKEYEIIRPEYAIDGTYANSGVAMLIKKSYKLEGPATKVVYDFATDVDRLSCKGFTHQKITKDGSTHHIIGTHTQAQYKNKPHQVIATLAQLAALGDYITAQKAGAPEAQFTVVGDLNIMQDSGVDVRSSDYRLLSYLLYPLAHQAHLAPTFSSKNTLLKPGQSDGGRDGVLDYTFSDRQQTKAEVIQPKFNDDKDVSDHYGLSVEISTTTCDTDPYHKQKMLLSRILRFAFDRASTREFSISIKFYDWKIKSAGAIYQSASALVEWYDGLNDEEKNALPTTEEALFYHFMRYKPKQHSAEARFFKPKAGEKVHSLAECLVRNNREAKAFYRQFIKEEVIRLNGESGVTSLNGINDIQTAMNKLGSELAGPFNFKARRRVHKYLALKFVSQLEQEGSEVDQLLSTPDSQEPSDKQRKIMNYIRSHYPLYDKAMGESQTQRIIVDHIQGRLQPAPRANGTAS